MARTNTRRADIYTRITQRVIEQLEQGVRPWLRPWNTEHAAARICRPLRHNGEAYKGINILVLWDAAEQRGFDNPYWMTFQQAKALGGFVKKGERGSPVVYANTFKKLEVDESGEECEHAIPFLREYTVFNAAQIEGLPDRFQPSEAPEGQQPLERIEQADTFFANTQAEIRYGGTQAYYSGSGDYVQMPPFVTFRDTEAHAATLAHELTHWTKHEARLDRNLGRKKWGDAGYAMEELVAEMGSAFLCADLKITPEVHEDHASYIASWLEVLKNDKRAVFSAASLASQAVDFLHGLHPQEQP